jgi:ADP-dependent NAD(P)H-hydrate dehydratase / NAD(P)H-hydrate epimerase
MKVLTAAQMREVDRRTTEEHGVPSLELMENAGTRVVEFLAERFADLSKRKIVVLCGKGNNGGDGFVVARLLRKQACNVSALLLATPDSVKGDAAVNLKRWSDIGGKVLAVSSETEWTAMRQQLVEAEIIVDALLGTGLSGPADGLLARVINDTNEFGKRAIMLAVDIPSGLPSDSGEPLGPAISADFTVTFTAPKPGLLLPPNCDKVGELHVGVIGTPLDMLRNDKSIKLHWLEPGEFSSLPLQRKPGGHKGDYGHALIVAGSRGKTGAAVLAAMGALRAGAGLVTVATPERVLPIIASHVQEMMTEPLAGTDADSVSMRALDYGRMAEITKGKNVLGLGPGLGTLPETQQFIRTVVHESPLPMILDADGLNAFAGRAIELRERKSPLAVTPHPGEMARLLGCTSAQVQGDRLSTALKAATQWNAFVVLKGQHTIVASPDGRAFINTTGNPGMATGGTGDVLTGMLAGLTAQFASAPWEQVLSLGVYLHGLAGDFAAEQFGEQSLIATDLVAAIPRAWRQLRSSLGHG